MEIVNYSLEKIIVYFVNLFFKDVGDDEDLEVDECSDWIVFDDVSDDIGNIDVFILFFDEEVLFGNVN